MRAWTFCLLLMPFLLAASAVGCDDGGGGDACNTGECNAACVAAGYPSGVCASGECECLGSPDGDGDADTDVDGDSDADPCQDGPCNARCLGDGHGGGGYCDDGMCVCVDTPDGDADSDVDVDADSDTDADSDADPPECERDRDCDDDDACNGEEECDDGECVDGEPVDCDDDVRCTEDSCDPDDGSCTNEPDHGLCDDDEMCTEDGCDDGTPCDRDSDCDDDDACNGEEECVRGVCADGDPVDCDDRIDCTEDVCDPSDGSCANDPDHSACRRGEMCTEDGCVEGTPCDDDDDCGDDEFCNGVESCVDGACAPGDEPDCDDDIACTEDSCAGDECRNAPDDDLCGDAEVCDAIFGCVDDPDHHLHAIEFEVVYPSVVDGLFPTYLSHLIGSPDLLPATIDLAWVTLTNTSDTARFDLRVQSSLTDFSTPVPETVTLRPGETVEFGISPSFDFDALFDLTSSRPGTIHTTVSLGGEVIRERSPRVTISSRNTAYISPEYFGFLSVFVTPHDAEREINRLLADAADLVPGRSMVGYDPISVTDTGPLEPGWLWWYSFTVEDPAVTETITTVLTSTAGSTSGAVAVVDQEDLDLARSGEPFRVYCQSTPPYTIGERLTCGPLGAGLYYVLYLNESRDETWFFTADRSLTHSGVVDVQLGAIYNVLQERGMRYVDAPADFLSRPTQTIYYPSETLDSLSGNCIDGTVLFAAALEAMGMRPYIFLVPGHAYLGVALWRDTTVALALETTMVGTHWYWEARSAGEEEFGLHLADGSLVSVNVPWTRTQAIRPAPSM